MLLSSPWRIMLVVAVSACLVPAASAQNVIFDAPGFMPKKKPPGPPAPRAQVAAWPRLDPGAVLCHTEDDLGRHAANMTAHINGGGTQAANCRLIAQPTAVQIVSRRGPGSTQVKLSASNETGWTDVWLPEKAPAGR
jgi:hypothetical protein